MKYISYLVTTVGVFSLILTATMCSYSQNESKLLNRHITSGFIQGEDFSTLLSKFAHADDIPIALELWDASDSDKDGRPAPDGSVSLKIPEGTLEEVLNKFVTAFPKYAWRFEDGVVIFFPKAGLDSVTSELLGTQIESIKIEKRYSKLFTGETISDAPEVKKKMNKAGVTPLHWSNIEDRKLDARSPISEFLFEKKTVKEILNCLLLKSNARFWTIIRLGSDREFLSIVVD